MKHIVRLWMFFAMLLPACSHGGDVKLIIKSDKGVYRYGEDVVLSVSVENQSGREVVIWRSSFFLNHRLRVLNAEGVEPELTDLGKQVRAEAASDLGERRKNYPIKLAPGQIDQTHPPVKVTDIYKLPPGRYLIVVEYNDPQCEGFSGSLKSNQIQIEILP
jgi:hypothetical protein